MKKTNFLKPLALSIALVAGLSATLSSFVQADNIKPLNDIRVNQHAYLPSQLKVAVFLGPANANWELRKSNGSVVASGKTIAYGYDNASGDVVSHIDFSAYTGKDRNLTLHVGNSQSYPFDISDFAYAALKEDALMYFYHQRFGMPALYWLNWWAQSLHVKPAI